MRLPPSVIVHCWPDLRDALAPGRPVTPLSAPGAARYAGCLWWAELLAAANFSGPAFLDCADAPGRAVEAIRLGLAGIILTCEPARYAIVQTIAAAAGARLLPEAPPALDMAARNARRNLAAWLDDNP